MVRTPPLYLLALLLLPAATHGLEYVTERAQIAALTAVYAQHTDLALPALDKERITALAAGETLVEISAAGETDDDIEAVGVFGMQIVAAPRTLLWLSVMGANDERDYRLKRAMLSRSEHGAYVRYQHVDLPWPFRDRHWVIDCEKNLPVAEASNGLIWEHRWDLHVRGETLLQEANAAGLASELELEDHDNDIYLPANRGAWALVDLGDHRTLVIAFVDADLGGAIPGPLVRAFTRKQLKKGMQRLAEMSERVHRNYDESEPVHDGHGRLLTSAEARRVAQQWRAHTRLANLD